MKEVTVLAGSSSPDQRLYNKASDPGQPKCESGRTNGKKESQNPRTPSREGKQE